MVAEQQAAVLAAKLERSTNEPARRISHYRGCGNWTPPTRRGKLRDRLPGLGLPGAGVSRIFVAQ